MLGRPIKRQMIGSLCLIFCQLFNEIPALAEPSSASAPIPKCEDLFSFNKLGAQYSDQYRSVIIQREDNGRKKNSYYMRTDRRLWEYQYYIDLIAKSSEGLPKKYFDTSDWAGLDVLDAGCGGGLFVDSLRELNVNAVGVDIVLENHQRGKNYFREADVRSTGYQSNLFDIVVSSFNIFHYSETPDFYRESLREFIRILKPGGVLIILELNNGYEQILEFKDQLRVLNKINSKGKLIEWRNLAIQKIE